MPQISITFNNPINVSVQKGDTAYYLDPTKTRHLGTNRVDTSRTGKWKHEHNKYDDIIQIGDIISIDRLTNSITCDWTPQPSSALFPPMGAFIMFSKNNKVNLSSLLGYYAEIQFVNDSPDEAELFSVGADMFISSK